MDVKKTIKDSIDNARDTAQEAMHRSAADAERTRREIDGDEMTMGEKIASVASEAKNRAQAAADKTKRDVREHT